MDLKMQVRSHAAARVAADGDELSCRHGILSGAEMHVDGVGILPCQLQAVAYEAVEIGCEALQMAIDTRRAVRMAHIDSIAEAIHADGDTLHIAVGNGEDGLAHGQLGTDVDASVEMVGPGFTKIARQ